LLTLSRIASAVQSSSTAQTKSIFEPEQQHPTDCRIHRDDTAIGETIIKLTLIVRIRNSGFNYNQQLQQPSYDARFDTEKFVNFFNFQFFGRGGYAGYLVPIPCRAPGCWKQPQDALGPFYMIDRHQTAYHPSLLLFGLAKLGSVTVSPWMLR